MNRERTDHQKEACGIDTTDAIRRYDELKLALAKIGQGAIQLCRELGDQERVSLHQAVLARLVEDRFNLAVLGQFSRGKSTLMNALMGMDRLPTGVLPHTSVVTTVSYGETERVLVRCEGWPLGQHVSFAELPNYVTESGNPGNRRRVISAEIQLPVEMLRRGLVFIDTPGVGSAVTENTQSTMRYLPEIDAAILVTGFDSPLSDAELDFFREAFRSIGKVFVVVNKQDLVSEEERAKVVRYAEERLSEELADSSLRIFAVSARDALSGKIAGDRLALDRSGLPALENAVFGFLEEGKVSQLCKRTLERIRGLLQIQQAELVAAAANNPARNLSRIERTIEIQQDLREELAAKALSEMRQNLSRCLEPQLSRFFSKLEASVPGEFSSSLAAPDRLFGAQHCRGVMNQVSRCCAERLREWQAGSAAALEQTIRLSAGEALRDLEVLPARTWARVVDNGTRDSLDSEDRKSPTLNHPALGTLEWSGSLPWAIYLVPIQWVASAINGWFAAAVAELLADYRVRLMKALVAVAEDLLSEIDREVESRINDCGRRMTRAMKSGVALAVPQARLEELLLRLGRLRVAQPDRGSATSASWSQPDSTQPGRGGQGRESAWSACPICAKVTRAVFDFLARAQYDLGVDHKSQSRHAQSHGFCAFHTWAYESLASPQSICHAYPDLLMARGRQLKEAAARCSSGTELRRALSGAVQDSLRCVVCEVVRMAERESASEVVSRASGASEAPMPALCVPHLRTALENTVDPETARRLVAATGSALEVIADAMTRFAVKVDAVRRGSITSIERNAYSAGLDKLVGVRRLATNQTDDFG